MDEDQDEPQQHLGRSRQRQTTSRQNRDDRDDSEAPVGAAHPNKRRRLHHDRGRHDGQYPTSREEPESSPSLHDMYTVAWICALHIEMAAARVMLDQVHEHLPGISNDSNTYILGRVGHHNVVIACLPSTQYGMNNAATVLTHLLRSFPRIKSGLMVGIGGGVPSMGDIRLGDVVIGTRVMQNDMGKVVADGQIQRTASPRHPSQALSTAVSALRSRHELEPTQIPAILEEKFAMHPNYNRPADPDELFLATYDHVPLAPDCAGCDQSKLVPRRRRASGDPIIHYGGIASGNQVMRSGTTRDSIARDLDVHCFEMEAAGLMDILACLPIRGICDYSDSHKNKDWQRYAAAVAAAYAKELLAVLPPSGCAVKSTLTRDPRESNSLRYLVLISPFYDLRMPCHVLDTDEARLRKENTRQEFLHCLKFEQMGSRIMSIDTAHAKTCHWFIDHQDYKAWLDPSQSKQHHGFLWIKGKPGAGKSTLMRFLYFNMKRQLRDKHHVVASYFFHARGELLERSILGMYRSLLSQLFEAYPDIQAILDDPDLNPRGQRGSQSVNSLKDIFFNAVSALGQRSLTCFIDALDECDEQQAIEMVQFFEGLAEHCDSRSIPLRICFSSRHYPYIVVKRGREVVLENQEGHAKDLEYVILSRLRISDEVLVTKLLDKAAGVFLWVVLAVNILNREDQYGRLAMEKKLAEIPSNLSRLFKSILTRDNENMEHLLISLLWILCAAKPLRPEEFHHALWSSLSLKGLADPQIPPVSPKGIMDKVIQRNIISSTKGLAETTIAKNPTVQFIHESVRDYLIKERGLLELWPDLGFDWEITAHEKLKQCCMEYINHRSVHEFVSKPGWDEGRANIQLAKRYPFLNYATQHIFYHANAVADAIPQDQFLDRFPLAHWRCVANSLERHKIRHYPHSDQVYITYILAEKGASKLLQARLSKDPCTDRVGGRYRYPLFAALAHRHEDSIATLLGCTTAELDKEAVMRGLEAQRDFTDYQLRTPLSWAAQQGRTGLVKLLLRQGVSIDEPDESGQPPIMLALKGRHTAIVKLLLSQGATWDDLHSFDAKLDLLFCAVESNDLDWITALVCENRTIINATDRHGESPFRYAIRKAQVSTVARLIEEGAEINRAFENGQTPLAYALQRSLQDVAILLVDKGADVNSTCRSYGGSPLSMAMSRKCEEAASHLIRNGADVNARDETYHTPLRRALDAKFEPLARLLIERGAHVNERYNDGSTPILKALKQELPSVAALLVRKGADVNATLSGRPSLLLMVLGMGKLYEEVAINLIKRGADMNVRDEAGRTPLSLSILLGREPLARVLISHGADVNCLDNLSETPLTRAIDCSSDEVIQMLISKGADVNPITPEAEMPLIKAAEQGRLDVAQLLIKKGADATSTDRRGLTPSAVALRWGYRDLEKLLIEESARTILRRDRAARRQVKTA